MYTYIYICRYVSFDNIISVYLGNPLVHLDPGTAVS